MANGLNINVKQVDFLKKTLKEQNWMLFEAFTKLDTYGCRYAKGHYRRLYPIVVGGSLVGGAVITLVKLVFG